MNSKHDNGDDALEQCLASVVQTFEANRNEQNAISMKKYMKDNFDFLGMKAPERKNLTRVLKREINNLPKERMILFVQKLWALPEREYQYLALDCLDKYKKNFVQDDVRILQQLIITKSWWDTVDLLASICVGHLFAQFPALIDEYAKKWAVSENMWLRRTAILFQLKYKEKTDRELLFQIIEKNVQEKDFFIRKGIGWALREYSKTNQAAVAEFIHTHQLSNLSKKEGLKHIRAWRIGEDYSGL